MTPLESVLSNHQAAVEAILETVAELKRRQGILKAGLTSIANITGQMARRADDEVTVQLIGDMFAMLHALDRGTLTDTDLEGLTE